MPSGGRRRPASLQTLASRAAAAGGLHGKLLLGRPHPAAARSLAVRREVALLARSTARRGTQVPMRRAVGPLLTADDVERRADDWILLTRLCRW